MSQHEVDHLNGILHCQGEMPKVKGALLYNPLLPKRQRLPMMEVIENKEVRKIHYKTFEVPNLNRRQIAHVYGVCNTLVKNSLHSAIQSLNIKNLFQTKGQPWHFFCPTLVQKTPTKRKEKP